MPRALAVDLRVRAVEDYMMTGESLEVVAGRFKISVRTLSRWIKQSREEGSLKPRTERCGPRHEMDAEPRRALIKKLIDEDRNRRIIDLCRLFEEQTDIPISQTLVRYDLKAIGYTIKKKRSALLRH